MTILLVDDHAAVRSGLRMLLQSAGFGVLEAADSRQTTAHLQSQQVDLVLLDTQLESEDGIEIAAQIVGQRGKHPGDGPGLERFAGTGQVNCSR